MVCEEPALEEEKFSHVGKNEKMLRSDKPHSGIDCAFCCETGKAKRQWTHRKLREAVIVMLHFSLVTEVKRKRSGAVEACWAHNPEVPGSKPGFAISHFFGSFLFFNNSASIFLCHIDAFSQLVYLFFISYT